MGELSGLRRAAATAVAIVLLTVAGLLLAEPAQACACGGAVSPEGEPLTVEREVAALAFDGRTEDIVMQLDMSTDADDAAVIIPTPAEPHVQLADSDFFTDLEAMSAARVDYDYTWWPESGSAGSGDSAPAATGGVEVLDVVPLGPLEASVLSATDADGLTDWLGEHEYVMSDGMAEALSPYVSEGWHFVAIRMAAEQGTLGGEVQPVHLSFAASSLIYPMRISAAAETDQRVRTYVLADGRVRHTDPTAAVAPGELRYAGPIEEDLRTSPTWDQLAAPGSYLTVMDYTFDDPSRQIISDFTFASAPGAADYQEVVVQTRMRMIAGFPAGPVLLVLGLAVLAVAAVLVRHVLSPADGGARPSRSAHPVPARVEQHYSAPR